MPKIPSTIAKVPELFYDVLFTFVLSRITRAMVFPDFGKIVWFGFLKYIIVLAFFWLIWTHQVIYSSRYRERPVIDNIYLAVNLFLLIYLSSTFTFPAVDLTQNSKVVAALLLLSVSSQFWLAWREHEPLAQLLAINLFVGFCLTALSVLVGTNTAGNIVFALATASATAGPLLLRKRLTEQSHFNTISNRLTIFTVFICARSTTQVTDSLNNLNLQSVLFFGSTVLLLVSYLLVFACGINQHTDRSSIFALLIHFPLVTALLLMSSVARLFTAGRVIPLDFAAWMLVMLMVFTITLGLYLNFYRRDTVNWRPKRAFYFVFSFALFTLYGLVTSTVGPLFLVGLCAYLIADDLYLWQFVLSPEPQ
ncbi:low temperature requirement protein A [Lacticaseibacillus hulanensis]|uniref:low temperature requirement protein A n=1 Tax=Lacticaseibacillus hulanensis TaxID=2493111 RepID=UPI0013E3DFE0|nr:low temperature requirement protein A [Lacticaseibacillus hulanensis]